MGAAHEEVVERLGTIPHHHDAGRNVALAKRAQRQLLIIGVVFNEDDHAIMHGVVSSGRPVSQSTTDRPIYAIYTIKDADVASALCGLSEHLCQVSAC